MSRVYITPETLLHFLLDDDPEQSLQASSIFERAENGEVSVVIESVVVAECCVQLERPERNISKQDIANVMTRLFLMEGIETSQRAVLMQALDTYSRLNIDFVLAYVTAAAELNGLGESFIH